MKVFVMLILLFILIFGFRLPLIYNSAVLAFFLSLFFIFLSERRFCIFKSIFKLKYINFIFLYTLFIVLVSLIIIIFHQTYDMTYTKKYIGYGATLLITIFIYIVIYPNLKNKTDILKYIVYAFIAQSIIQIIALLNPSFLSFIQLFQDVNAIQISTNSYYQGIRGLSLSSELFFGLSGAYGLACIFFMKYILDNKTLNIFNIFLFLLLVLSAFFVGRTVLIGLLFSLLYYILYRGNMIKIKYIIKVFIVIITFLFVGYNSLTPNTKSLVDNVILPQVFDTSESGKGARSLSALSKMLSIPISEKTLLVGDGRYTLNGAYYKKTDSGYMRQVLYGGIFFVILNFLYLLSYFRLGKNVYFKSNIEKYNFYLFNVTIFTYLCVLHIKGEVTGTGKMIMIMLILTGLSNIKFYKTLQKE